MKSWVYLGSVVAGIAASVSLAGCHRQPAGQVVATVDGNEITRRDLLSELQALGGRSEADLKATQSSLVAALVDRKLLDQEARREKLDKNPEFLAAEQRQHDVLLASMLAQTFAARTPKPDANAVQQFIAENPQMFGGRKLLLANEISAPSQGIKPQDLAPLHGPQAVLDYLKAKHIAFRQRTATLDTLTLPKQLSDKLLAMPQGEPLAIANGSSYVFTTILNTRDAPVPPAQQAQLAQAASMQQSAGKQLQEELKQLRGAADIKYLPGFEPEKQPGNTPS